jgi:hypothetical protein
VQPKPQAELPTAPSPAEASKVSDADIMEDLQSILSGKKVFDPVTKQTVDKDKLGARPEEPVKNAAPERPVPEAKNEQAIFDRIAQSMEYANRFDLGSIELESRFADFDRMSDLQQKGVAKKYSAKSGSTSKYDPGVKVDSSDFIMDLDRIHTKRAENESALEEPAVSFSETLLPEIENLHLAETARKAAYALKQKHPSVIFTSGRRDKQGQAHAMAGNVVLNRKWIEQTYAASSVRDACQKWVDDNPEKKTAAEIEQGLLEVMNGFSDADLGHLSGHLSGMAFDVQPVTEGGEEIKASIRALPGLQKFLEKEGGLVRWHAQFQ